MSITPVDSVESLQPLVSTSENEGYRFVRRLVEQYRSGENRFDREGEALFECRMDGRVVGVCGLNIDPYSGRPEIGRIRHLYVLPAYRRLNVGRALVFEALAHARGQFEKVVLRTDSASAAGFYRALGFRESQIDGATHEYAVHPVASSRADHRQDGSGRVAVHFEGSNPRAEPTAMQVTREDLNPCTVKLSIVCSPDEVQSGFDKALKQISKKIKLPGFRPGHAPKGMVESLIQKEDLYNEAAENIVRMSFRKALEEQAISPDPTVRPTIDLTLLDQDTSAAEYTAKVPLPPKVEIGDYTGLPVEKPSTEVTDEEVEYQIEEIRKRRSTREPVTDRGVQEGDVAIVNIKPEGVEGEGRNFMTIAGQTFPELDQSLLGMRVEEMKSLELTFPGNFQEKDWANQTMKVQVALNSLSAVKLPELDETFAQSLQTENVEDLKTRLKQGLALAKENMVREIVHERLLEKLQERSTVHVSDNMWEALAARRLQETAEEQQKNDKTLEQYAAENGMTVDQLAEAWKEKAKMHVQRALLIREVFTKEQMQLTNDELNSELFNMANEFQVEAEAMLKMLQENEALDELHFRAIARKVGDFLLSKAEVTETPAEAAAEPATEVAAD